MTRKCLGKAAFDEVDVFVYDGDYVEIGAGHDIGSMKMEDAYKLAHFLLSFQQKKHGERVAARRKDNPYS